MPSIDSFAQVIPSFKVIVQHVSPIRMQASPTICRAWEFALGGTQAPVVLKEE